MLYLSGDAAGNIHLGMNSYTRLANLPVVVDPARIHSGTAGSHLSVEFLCQLEELVESFLTAHAVTSGDDDGSTFQVVLGCLYMPIDDLHYIVSCGHIFGCVGINHFSFGFTLVKGFLHDTRTHGSHLWAMVGIDNSGNDVAPESRTNLIEQIFIVLTGFLFVVVSYFQLCAVGCESAGQ